jgi:hypothetical protein
MEGVNLLVAGYLLAYCSTLKMEAVLSSETSIGLHDITFKFVYGSNK